MKSKWRNFQSTKSKWGATQQRTSWVTCVGVLYSFIYRNTLFLLITFLKTIYYCIRKYVENITTHQLTRRTLIFSLQTVSINNFTKFYFKYFQSPSSSLMLRAPLMMRSDEQYQLPWTKFIPSNTRSIITCVHAL